MIRPPLSVMTVMYAVGSRSRSKPIKTFSRFSIDIGLKKGIQNGKGELFVNATDIANTLNLKREIRGKGFRYISTDYYETQIFRLGYSYKF